MYLLQIDSYEAIPPLRAAASNIRRTVFVHPDVFRNVTTTEQITTIARHILPYVSTVHSGAVENNPTGSHHRVTKAAVVICVYTADIPIIHDTWVDAVEFLQLIADSSIFSAGSTHADRRTSPGTGEAVLADFVSINDTPADFAEYALSHLNLLFMRIDSDTPDWPTTDQPLVIAAEPSDELHDIIIFDAPAGQTAYIGVPLLRITCLRLCPKMPNSAA